MKYILKFSVLIIPLFFSHTAKSTLIDGGYKGTWAGIEIIGVEPDLAQEIKMLIPFQIGSNFVLADMQKYKSVCQEIIKNYFPTLDGHCSCVLYKDKKVFLVMDVISSKTRNKSNIFRIIPKKEHGTVPKLPQKLYETYQALEEKRSLLISKGTFPKEKTNDGYIDYDDTTLHNLAFKLSKYVPKYNDVLLDIVHYSTDVEERRTAAILFSWAQHPDNMDLVLKWNILFDPDAGVRNNIARSYVFIMQDMRNKILLKKIIPIYCKQAELPTHTDRNKALVSMLEIFQGNKELARILNPECEANIRYISKVSILDNVGGIAKEIVKLIDDNKDA